MIDYFEIKTIEQLKAITHPLRRRLKDEFCKNICTTKQAAKALGEPPTKLYHHVEILKKAGVIKLVKTKQNRGTTEKYYETVASNIRISPSLLESSATAELVSNELYNLVKDKISETLHGVTESFEEHVKSESPGKNPVTTWNYNVHLTEKKKAEFDEMVQKWLQKNTDPEESGAISTHIAMFIYKQKEEEYISLTDMAKFRDSERTNYIIQNWMRTRNTIEFLGLWEQLKNPNFKGIEFDAFKN